MARLCTRSCAPAPLEPPSPGRTRGAFLWVRHCATLAYRRRRERGSCGAVCLRGGRIAAVELLDAKSDEEAVEQWRMIFEQRKSKFEGFEVWDYARKVAHDPPREADAESEPPKLAPYLSPPSPASG